MDRVPDWNEKKNYAQSFSTIFISLSFDKISRQHPTHNVINAMEAPTNEQYIWYAKYFAKNFMASTYTFRQTSKFAIHKW